MPRDALRPAQPRASFQLAGGADSRLAAEGPLTFANARIACALGLLQLAGAGAGAGAGAAFEIDCGALSPCDSAGLAVLLEWLGSAKRAGRRLRYVRLPPELRALAHISEVEELLTRGV